VKIFRLIHDLILNQNCQIILTPGSTIANYLTSLMEPNGFLFSINGAQSIYFHYNYFLDKKCHGTGEISLLFEFIRSDNLNNLECVNFID
jgi:hypothetical protein